MIFSIKKRIRSWIKKLHLKFFWKDTYSGIDNDILLHGLEAAMIYDALVIIEPKLKDSSLWDWLETQPKENKKFYHQTIRYFLTGREKASPNKTIVDVIGIEESIKRLQTYKDMLDKRYDFKQLYDL